MALEKFFPPTGLGGVGGFVRLFQEAGRPGGSDVLLKLFYSVHKTTASLNLASVWALCSTVLSIIYDNT